MKTLLKKMVLLMLASLGLWGSWAEGQQEVVVLQGHTDRVFSVAFSPDGTLLASAQAMSRLCGCGMWHNASK